MAEYRMGVNGFFNSQLTDAELPSIFRNLGSLRRDSMVDFTVVLKGHTAVEIIRLVKQLTGDNFAQWMRVNADGPLSVLVKDILNYLNGKVGHLTMNTSISIQEGRLKGSSKHLEVNYTPTIRNGSSIDHLLKGDYNLTDYDLYRLISGIGPLSVGRIFLLLGGETYYA